MTGKFRFLVLFITYKPSALAGWVQGVQNVSLSLRLHYLKNELWVNSNQTKGPATTKSHIVQPDEYCFGKSLVTWSRHRFLEQSAKKYQRGVQQQRQPLLRCWHSKRADLYASTFHLELYCDKISTSPIYEVIAVMHETSQSCHILWLWPEEVEAHDLISNKKH